MEERLRLPQISGPAYFQVRRALQRALPAAVTPEWIMANVQDYEDKSARALLGQFRLLKLVDDEGKPTNLAKKWRLDESYDEACEAILRNAFPADIVDAVSGTDPKREVVEKLLMARGLGANTAKNVARLFLLLASPRIREHAAERTRATPANASEPADESTDGKPGKTRRRRARATTVEQPPISAPAPPSAMTVLRYFLESGRLAELSIPRDISTRERRKLFRHLEIDLLDADQDEDGQP